MLKIKAKLQIRPYIFVHFWKLIISEIEPQDGFNKAN